MIFKEDSLYIVDLLKLCIEKKGFNESIRTEINKFYETNYEDEDPQISEEIASVYMAFLGKTDFKNLDSDASKKHLKLLLSELEHIEEKINAL
ncbi:hypothetical protein ACE3MZ_13635 [Paenibacillus sp. WLX1005]|uniref:hypothetical protein n=1 Tax=Paenibacillus sp. WLX1005 TaxID=3243766 RepID=UPI00398447FA